MFAYRL